ncbi:cytochrome b5-related protein isoform X2 [Procambarus clarkii]|uniref:cytochrome b5-related protein isoform X2 n=1 Tax=Procambarus clarkii TaxID=6728 RepID=UPI0037420B64
MLHRQVKKMAPKQDFPRRSENSNGIDQNGLANTGFRHYPSGRDLALKTSLTWINGKRKDDDVGPYWRIHDKLYDMTNFIDKHPGGKDWLLVTKGTDITEAFESSHINTVAESILPKYYVKDISTPRNSPFTFHEDGFYKTLKRKVQPILKKVGKGPTWTMVLMQDALVLTFILLTVAACLTHSYTLAVFAGIVLGMTGNCAHNFFHQRDNWRMYYFDLLLFSSYDWRISHGLSHHLFPNTIYDMEVSALEPIWEFFPKPDKTFMQRYGFYVYELLVIPIGMFIEVIKRMCHNYTGELRLRPENLLPVVELIVMILFAESVGMAVRMWLVLHMACSSWFFIIGLIAAHHHPDIYHHGDAVREDKDWGLLQLDAVRDRVEVTGNLFLVSIAFGDHSLHHLLPTVDHSKLPYLYPAFLETCKEFGIPFKLVRQWDLFIGRYQQLANITPNPNPPGYKKS